MSAHLYWTAGGGPNLLACGGISNICVDGPDPFQIAQTVCNALMCGGGPGIVIRFEPFNDGLAYSYACKLRASDGSLYDDPNTSSILSYAQPTHRTSGVSRVCQANRSNPINVATGQKYQLETDYVGLGPLPLEFKRTYVSAVGAVGTIPAPGMGTRWRHNYARSLYTFPATTPP